MVNWIVGKTYRRRDGKEVTYIGPLTNEKGEKRAIFYGKRAADGVFGIQSRNEDGTTPAGPQARDFDVLNPSIMTPEERSAVIEILNGVGKPVTAQRMLREHNYTPDFAVKVVVAMRKFKNG